MRLYVNFAAREFVNALKDASERGNPENLRILHQRLVLAFEPWRSYANANGGSVLMLADGHGVIEIPAGALSELSSQIYRFGKALSSTVSVGVGDTLERAATALKAAEAYGGNRTTFYSDDVEQFLRNKNKSRDPLEDIIQQEDDHHVAYEDRFNRNVALSKAAAFEGSRAGFHGAAEKARPAAPASPKAAASEHSEAEALESELNDPDRPPPAEKTHAASDFEDKFHEIAAEHHSKEAQDQAAQQNDVDAIRQKVAQVLLQIKQQSPQLAQLKQAAPESYQAILNLIQSVIVMGRALPQPLQKGDVLQFPGNAKPVESKENPANVVDLSEVRNDARKHPNPQLQEAMDDILQTMASDDGFQQAARKQRAEQTMREHSIGKPLYSVGQRVSYHDPENMSGEMGKWVGRIKGHELHYNHERDHEGNWVDKPYHSYIVKWTTPTGSTHEGLHDQEQLKPHMVKMALRDVKDQGPEQVKGYNKAFNYDHLLPERFQNELSLSVVHEGDGNYRAVDAILRSKRNPDKHLGYVSGQVYQEKDEPKRLGIIESTLNPDLRGKGLGQAMYEAVMAHAVNHHQAQEVEGMEHSSMAARVHQKLAQKHNLDYQPKINEDWGEDDVEGPNDFKNAPYSYALKSERPLEKMALADIKGKPLGSRPDPTPGYEGELHEHDYTHLLPTEYQQQGYKLTTGHRETKIHGPGNYFVETILTDPNGSHGQLSSFASASKFANIGSAYLSEKHRGKGLGQAMYEAHLSHLKNVVGMEAVAGSTHSTSAHHVHSKLAQKHGLEYEATKRHNKEPGPYDEAYSSYSYDLKSEPTIVKSELHQPVLVSFSDNDVFAQEMDRR